MKTFVTVAVIVALLALGAGWSNHYINTSAVTLVQKLDQVEELINNQNWNQARSQLKQMENDWGVTKDVWSVLVTHQEIDNIDIALNRLEEFVHLKSPILATSELATVRLLVDHIADTESFNLRNIL